MTSPHSANLDGRPLRSGFTLVEMLVVVGILAILISLVTLGVQKVQRTATITRIKGDFQAISAALEQYHSDFGNYPMSGPIGQSPAIGQYPLHVLAKALVSPEPAIVPQNALAQDGKDGFGFKAAQGGREYPAYLNPDQFKTKVIYRGGAASPSNYQLELLDHEGHPIAYFPRRAQPKGARIPLVTNATNVQDPLYNAYYLWADGPYQREGVDDVRQGLGWALAWALQRPPEGATRQVSMSAPAAYLTPGWTQVYDGPFVLISSGTDGLFTTLTGSESNNQQSQIMRDSDDVYNFDWK